MVQPIFYLNHFLFMFLTELTECLNSVHSFGGFLEIPLWFASDLEIIHNVCILLSE